MFKEVVMCSECEYFFVNNDGSTMCTNKRGIPFPGTNDFCSRGEQSSKTRNIDNGELLRLVYEQRKK